MNNTNPLTPTVATRYTDAAIKHIMCRTRLSRTSFVIFDIRALWHSGRAAVGVKGLMR